MQLRYGVSLDRIVGSCWVKGRKALPAIPARWRASCFLLVIPVLMEMETADYLSLLIFPGYCLSENTTKTIVFVLHVNDLQVLPVFIPIVYFPTVLKGTKSRSRILCFCSSLEELLVCNGHLHTVILASLCPVKTHPWTLFKCHISVS